MFPNGVIGGIDYITEQRRLDAVDSFGHWILEFDNYWYFGACGLGF